MSYVSQSAWCEFHTSVCLKIQLHVEKYFNSFVIRLIRLLTCISKWRIASRKKKLPGGENWSYEHSVTGLVLGSGHCFTKLTLLCIVSFKSKNCYNLFINYILQNLDSNGIMNQLSFCWLLAVALSQLLLFCWYGNELTYEVTEFSTSLVCYKTGGSQLQELSWLQ
jgi:hypothetical protein